MASFLHFPWSWERLWWLQCVFLGMQLTCYLNAPIFLLSSGTSMTKANLIDEVILLLAAQIPENTHWHHCSSSSEKTKLLFLEKLPSKFSINHSTYLSAMDAFGGSMRDFTVAISAGVTGCVKRLSGFRCLEDALVTFLVTGDLGWWWASRVLLMGELTGCIGCVLYLEGRQEGRNWLGSNSYINSSDKPLTRSNGEKCLGVEPNLNVREDHSVLKMHL